MTVDTKPKRGGPNRNQGRPSVHPTEPTITVSLRMTKPHREKLKQLGGASWVRKQIENG